MEKMNQPQPTFDPPPPPVGLASNQTYQVDEATLARMVDVRVNQVAQNAVANAMNSYTSVIDQKISRIDASIAAADARYANLDKRVVEGVAGQYEPLDKHTKQLVTDMLAASLPKAADLPVSWKTRGKNFLWTAAGAGAGFGIALTVDRLIGKKV